MGKLILISGASTGIGRAAALRFAEEGHEVLAGVRNETAADELRESSGGKLTPVHLDITEEGTLDKFCKEYAERLNQKGLDGLLNNAGVAVVGSVEHTSLKKWRDQFDVNFFGHVEMTRRVIPAIRKAHGRIIFTGSIGGKLAFPMGGPYCASKFALEGLADSLRREMHDFGVSVSIVEPGGVETPMLESANDMIQIAIDAVSGDGAETYRQTGEGLKKAMDGFRSMASPPEKVVDAFRHALFSSKPKARYLIGKDAKFQSALKRTLPDSALDAFLRKMMKS